MLMPLILGENEPIPLNRTESSLQRALQPALIFVACFKALCVLKTAVTTALSVTPWPSFLPQAYLFTILKIFYAYECFACDLVSFHLLDLTSLFACMVILT